MALFTRVSRPHPIPAATLINGSGLLLWIDITFIVAVFLFSTAMPCQYWLGDVQGGGGRWDGMQLEERGCEYYMHCTRLFIACPHLRKSLQEHCRRFQYRTTARSGYFPLMTPVRRRDRGEHPLWVSTAHCIEYLCGLFAGRVVVVESSREWTKPGRKCDRSMKWPMGEKGLTKGKSQCNLWLLNFISLFNFRQ